MLEVDRLAYGYRGTPVGRDASFTVGASETVGLLGPNGCGKTTLFRTVLGLLPALGGCVRLGGCDLSSLSRREIAQRIGYVPQAQGGYFPFTVREMVLMGRTAHLSLFAAPGARDDAVAERMLEMLGIRHLGERRYTEISGGERQLALIARALTQEPKLLVMDEPTSNLDFGNQLRVLERIDALAQHGMAVILSTHDPDQAFRCCDKVVLLERGRMLGCASPEEAITPATLKQLYGVDVEVVEVETAPGRRLRICTPASPPSSG